MIIAAERLSRQFNRRHIFRDVTFAVGEGEVFGITGKNGSGKSTLLKILGGVLSPSGGAVRYTIGGAPVAAEHLHRHIGFAAPYLALFEEFSAEENLRLFARIRRVPLTTAEARAMLDRVGLPTDRADPIRAFSSGMKQRMKLLFATLHRPPILLLDEPISNLDADGIAVVYDIVREHAERGCVVIATNDRSDIDRCHRTVQLAAAIPAAKDSSPPG